MTTQTLEQNHQHNSPEGFLLEVGPGLPKAVPVGEFLTIGRDLQNQLQVEDPYVSTRHARVEKKTNGYLLRDLRSRNGTLLNGARILEALLKPGDLIQIGEREFVFHSHVLLPSQHASLKSKNTAWNEQLQSLPIFSQTDLPVLLLGSSGSGKEILAKLVHKFSKRAAYPFVSVNCSALSESLVESELFGHVKGSFTGATHDRKGAFESARGGTLFLDEIGDLPLSLQPKLLRALENQEIRPVGLDRTVSTDVRIIAATHQNLQKKIQSGQFRWDLYFRLHVIKMAIPNLNERPEDFEDLLNHFAREMRVRFSVAAIAALKDYRWPGNIRELKNAVARASALFPGVRIEEQHVNRLVDTPVKSEVTEVLSQDMPFIKEIEREIIRQRLLANRGNQRKTAAELNMPKSTLHDRIKAYGIDLEELMKDSQILNG